MLIELTNWPPQVDVTETELSMRLEQAFEHNIAAVRNERVKLAADFWNTTGAGLFLATVAGGFFSAPALLGKSWNWSSRVCARTMLLDLC
jgi:hypothetical protein